MGREIEVSIDQTDLELRLQSLRDIKNGAPRALMHALNRTLTGMGTDAAKQASVQYIIKQKDVKANLNKSRANMSNLSITMRSKGRPIRLVKFRVRANTRPGRKGGKPAFAKVKRDGSGGRIPGAFMANFQAGKDSHEGVFVRTGRFAKMKRGRHQGQVREQIRQLHGPGVVQMLSQEDVKNVIQSNATERFNKQFDHEVRRILKKQEGR